MIKRILCVLLCLITALPLSFSAFADGSHGFFMDCDASVVNQQADGFMIDFYSDSAEALCTYWSNANWSMDTSVTEKIMGTTLTGGGAYAGLQIKDAPDDRTGIMSLWRYEYKSRGTGKIEHIYAKALFGKTTTYDNEGSGTSCVMPFDWKSNTWYRQLLLCWTDSETGNTFIGTWFYDYDADKWTLFAYYNTFLQRSFIKGGIGQFLENFSESKGALYRSFRYRNIYFLSHQNGNWVSSPKVNLRSDGNPKAFGEAKLGVSDDGTYVWASVDGKSSVDTDHTLSVKPTLVQPDSPAYGKPEIAELSVRDNGSVRWKMAENSTPQLSYKLTVTDENGKLLRSRSATRPETVFLSLDKLNTDVYKCTLTVTDVFGQTAEKTFLSEGYKALSEKVDPPATEPAAKNENGKFPVLPVAIGGAVAVLAIAASVAMVVVKRKKKR